MARDCPESDSETVNRGANGTRPSRLDRRSYLRLAGAGALTVGALGAGATPASAAEYDVIEAQGQMIEIGDGETFENVLIDLTTGDGVTLYARHSTNWTIRNVGFRGYNEAAGFRLSVSDTGGGSSLVENLYLADGSAKVGSFAHGPGAIFMGPEHTGHITFRHCNVQGYPNNGFYCSNGSGTVTFEECLAKNNGVSNFRCSTDGDLVEGCVAYNDDTSYGWDGGYVEEHGRPLWAWPDGPVTVRESHFADGPYPYAMVAGANNGNGRVTFESGAYRGSIRRAYGSTVSIASSVGSNPDLSIPAGCPTSPEAAAGGGQTTEGPDTGMAHLFEFDGTETTTPTDYYFEIESGPIEPADANGATIDEERMWVSDDGTRAAGRVTDGSHAWAFDTLLVDVTVNGPATAIIDGQESHLNRYPQPGATGDDWKGDMPWQQPDHRLLIDGVGTTGRVNYEFTTSGQIEPDEQDGVTLEDTDTIDGTHAVGVVDGWRDGYQFAGDLEALSVDGGARVFLDGNRIDPAAYGEAYDHTLTVAALESDTRYRVDIDGAAAPVGYDPGADTVERVDDGVFDGSLDRQYQRFRVAGTVAETATLAGRARFYLDGVRR